MQQEIFKQQNSGAEFSRCRTYRYALWRIWDEAMPPVMFIGLNPSKADEHKLDPTMRRVIRFAQDWGYGGVYMTNLFAYVSTNPDGLKKIPDPVGENDWWLEYIRLRCKDVVFAWGNFQQAENRAKFVQMLFPEALCLQLNKNGSPQHPLFVPANVKPVKFT